MTKTIGAAVAATVMAVAIVAWSRVAIVKPDAAAATNATAAMSAPTLSPFDTMITRGKNLALEDWRPTN
jgi:hypothetical protein